MPYLTLGNKVGSNQEIVESFPERHIGAVCAKRYPLKQSRDSRKSSALPPIVEELRSGSNQEIVERLSRLSRLSLKISSRSNQEIVERANRKW